MEIGHFRLIFIREIDKSEKVLLSFLSYSISKSKRDINYVNKGNIHARFFAALRTSFFSHHGQNERVLMPILPSMLTSPSI